MSGVLKNSKVIRDRLLEINDSFYGGYESISKNITSYEMYTRPLFKIMGEQDLYGYTHNNITEYGKRIGHHYFKDRNDFTVYSNNIPINPHNFWGGEYFDYYDYVNTVYSQISPPIRFIEGLIANQYLDEALRVDSPGIVHNPEPTLSLAGAVKTNINNFSGTDTRLGLITNQMYAHSLFHGANFNTMRKTAQSNYISQITPSVGIRFGNSNFTINALSSIVSPLRADGKIIEDYNDGISIIHNISETINADYNPINLYDNLSRGLMYQFDNFGKEIQYTFESGDYSNTDSKNYNFKVQGKNNGITQHTMYEDIMVPIINNDFEFDSYEILKEEEDLGFAKLKTEKNFSEDSLLLRTNKLFKQSKINNGLGNALFYSFTKQSDIDTASITKVFGKNSTTIRSRGRNLLSKREKSVNGINNPFCRTWTYHHQYDKLNKLIRPLDDENGRLMTIEKIQENNKNYRSFNENGLISGDKYLSENTVLENNGMVKIAPYRDDEEIKSGSSSIKKCMFSIENLAWKDVLNKEEYLSKEQRGPNGGRIMWFPPYDLNFSENTNVNWESSTFIGRGEKVYTYSNTDRTGNLSFTLLIDHPSTIHNIYNKEGNVNNSITDEDILRFFAGCSPLEVNFEEETPIPPQTQTPPDPKPEFVTQEVKIYVHFPNNYTGHKNTPITSAAGDTTTEPDGDFLEYMLFGQNTGINMTWDKTSGVYKDYTGYEMIKNKGISINSTIGTIDVCENAKLYEDCKKTINEQYFYRVDSDLRQVLSNKNNYKDTTSTSLNNENKLGSFSFLQLAYVIADATGNTDLRTKIINTYSEEVINSELLNILSEEKLKDIEFIEFKGSASNQNSKQSNVLAHRRCATLENLFKKAFPNIEGSKYGISTIATDGTGNSVNTENIKKNRFACVVIKYKVAKTETLLDDETTKKETEQTNDKLSVTHKEGFIRYENEAQYFTKLKSEDPITFKKLTDKFKYFTPAFHSISPEGFNARLTFLQQCTRQGHTIESRISESGDASVPVAGNLAFGRMPVCVLRIGDFIYSRILITSMTINYGKDGIQWDLNPEGAGVQPMMATVNLGITILGGQSLEGPISKLQNAISFNYYANTGVYDDRSDRATPITNENGSYSTRYDYVWEPENDK